MVRRALLGHGYDIATAPTASRAHDLLASDRFDLAVVELGPGGVTPSSGLCLIDDLKKRNADIAIVAVTRHSDAQDESGFGVGTAAVMRGAHQFVNRDLRGFSERLMDAVGVAVGMTQGERTIRETSARGA